jgi:hypothetical protein
MNCSKSLGLLLGLVLLVGSVVDTQAQCSNDPNVPGVGFYTLDLDSLLDTATLNMPYNEVITIVPPSTWFVGPPLGSINVDSILIVSIADQPDGITIATNPMPLKLYPGDTGCIAFSGTPTNPANQGENTLLIKFRAWGFGIPYNEDVDDFSIYMKDPTSFSLPITPYTGPKYFPNPAGDHLSFQFDTDEAEVELINVLGEVVRTWVNPENYVSLDGIRSGVYLIRIRDGEEHVEDRLIVR